MLPRWIFYCLIIQSKGKKQYGKTNSEKVKKTKLLLQATLPAHTGLNRTDREEKIPHKKVRQKNTKLITKFEGQGNHNLLELIPLNGN